MYTVQGLDQDTVNQVLDEFLAIIKTFDSTSSIVGGSPYLDENYVLLQDGDKFINMTRFRIPNLR